MRSANSLQSATRFLLFIVAGWLAISVLTAALQLAASSADRAPALEPVVKVAASILYVPAIVGFFLLRPQAMDHFGFGVLAAAIGWAPWFLAILVWRRGRTCVSPSPRDEGALPDLGRRRFLLDAAAGAGTFAMTGGVVHAAAFQPLDLAVRRYRIPIRGLAPAHDGLRIVQISDTHFGPRVPASLVERAVRIALELEPGVFALTGDYIARGRAHIDRAAALFRPLVESGVPVVGVLGNHDWWGDAPRVRAAMTAVGVRMIDNGRIFLDADLSIADEPTGRGLCIAGLGDLWEDAVLPERALRDVPPDMPRVLLAHNPDTAEEPSVLRGPRADLMLCGHTHGGQVRLPILGAPIVPSAFGAKYAGGVAQGPAFPVVISRGVGMSGVPVRIGVPPEVVEITLVRS